MKKWSADTVRLDRLEGHLNQLSADGYEIYGLYPVMLPIGGDAKLTTFLVAASKRVDYIEKEIAQVKTEAATQ